MMDMKNKKFQVVALDPNGKVVMDKTTQESWSISELQVFFDDLKLGLYHGKIQDVAISAIDG
jgi:hypothetical protein